jgi:transcriptional regulator with XRE-family HTH domain
MEDTKPKARLKAEVSARLFAGRLRDLRVAAGLNQGQLADLVDRPPSRISEYESGTRVPGWEMTLALAFALGVGVEEFARGPKPKGRKGRT